jgi:PhnB protein
MASQTIVPYLCVDEAEKAISYYQSVFGATELDRYQEPGEPVGHCTLEIYGNRLFLSDEFPEITVLSPKSLGGSPVMIYVSVPNVDETIARVRGVGGTVDREPADQGSGERNAKFIDPFGHRWMVASPLAKE